MGNLPTVGNYLLDELKRLGVNRVFGIPGDYIIKFFKLVEDDPAIDLCTFSHEPAVGFAAIAEARATKKPAVSVVTYGPGALNMVNAVACAYAEKTPLIVISGGPAISARHKNFFVHHTIKNCETQLNAYSEVTVAAVILDNPKTSVVKIAKVLKACQDYMLPVYIEVPADIINEQITLVNSKQASPPFDNENNVEAASAEILRRLSKAKNPVIIVGVESERFNLKEHIAQLSEKLNVPVVSTLLARDLIPTDARNFFGTYLGSAGSVAAEKLVTASDLLLILGEMLSDVNLGAKLTATKGPAIIWCFSGQVNTLDQTYENVPLKNLLEKLCKAPIDKKDLIFPAKVPLKINATCKLTSTPIVMSEVIDALNWFFSKYGQMPLIADTGDCLFATLKVETSTVMAPSFYATMGFAVPAAIGYALATEKRPLVLVGDGGFQMTGPEMCHCPRYGINPIFVVINNERWGMEQVFYPSARFNELVNWHYSELANLWGGKGYLCNNCEMLYKALEDAEGQKTFTVIEVVTEREELSEQLLAWIKEQRGEK